MSHYLPVVTELSSMGDVLFLCLNFDVAFTSVFGNFFSVVETYDGTFARNLVFGMLPFQHNSKELTSVWRNG